MKLPTVKAQAHNLGIGASQAMLYSPTNPVGKRERLPVALKEGKSKSNYTKGSSL
ncbi:MAG: hypothetical protein P5694_23575 [Limnospira sp. PMC 1286.21]|uniref:hypothetical protein n=1 Tax=Limnospira TaxID=2596745 RepID=UPI0002804519|nr:MULTISPECIES: hypothetical protein [Limnospira]EKD06406.1 hypothetical protein SPLC1_S543510 [Arthrospira platensis C1]MDT9190772.1 hypothetical protein [Limnospira sp. PMC 894.15]MDT9216401.1 hypothetical protein [Limnospira sp. PMC 1256.20]MDT9303152.1 hypothetical protein [Limnospira sp. PMC 1281.21]MDT9328670.1 hypothetical protein [Limnospira sp. PMC 1286.21]